MKETVGPMDSRYGYSSEKLVHFFNEMFYIDPFTRRFDNHGNVGEEQILSVVTETLLLINNYKQLVKLKYRGFFTRSELAFIFQYFNGKLIDYSNVNVFDQHTQFIKDSDLCGYEEFRDEDEGEDFIEKVNSMSPFDFFILGSMIIEDWEKIPVPVLKDRKNLFDELVGTSNQND